MHKDFKGHFAPVLEWPDGRLETLPTGCTAVTLCPHLDPFKAQVWVTWGAGGKYSAALPAPNGLPDVRVVRAADHRKVAVVKAGKRDKTVNFYLP